MEETKIIRGSYDGERGPLFNLAFKTAILTALTLGVYRFWAKTRVRNYVWSSVSGDGDSFEYTGTGLEKFLGFLVAIVILAIYLGVIQMILFYFGLTLFREAQSEAEMAAQALAVNLTILAVVPLIFFAQYRARRYRLARTRWRGLRFGAEKGAWGYAARAIGHSVLTILTLGLLLPRQTFSLEKYMTDRSWYGDARFEQTGKWTALYPAMKHLFIGIAILVVGVGAAAALGLPGLAALCGIVGYVWVMIGYVFYRVKSFTYLAGHKVLDGRITFDAGPETGTIVKTVVVGGLVVGLIMAVVFAIVGGLAAVVLAPAAVAAEGGSFAGMGVALVVLAGAYIAALAVAGALALVWITQPVIAHVVMSITVRNAGALDEIRQRAADTGADAEGFADALDVGGAL